MAVDLIAGYCPRASIVMFDGVCVATFTYVKMEPFMRMLVQDWTNGPPGH